MLGVSLVVGPSLVIGFPLAHIFLHTSLSLSLSLSLYLSLYIYNIYIYTCV